MVSAAIYKWLCGILFALAVPQPTGFGTAILAPSVIHAAASLAERGVRILGHLGCFKRANRGDGVEYPFGTVFGEQLDLADRPEVQRCFARVDRCEIAESPIQNLSVTGSRPVYLDHIIVSGRKIGHCGVFRYLLGLESGLRGVHLAAC